jgi:ubiquinone/menaquinone biosynthesis C-methylase UbiE
MLLKAQQNVPQAQFSWYDGERLPFDDGTFDVVVAVCVLHHVPVQERSQVVSEMVRVSRHEGVVAVFEHNPYNPLTRHAVNTCALDCDAVLLPPRETIELLKGSAAVEPEHRHYLFTPLGGAIGCSLDRYFRRIPFGGQYVAWVPRSTVFTG